MARIRFYPAPGVKVSDADALVTDVKDPKTFYSVAAPRKTGTMPTETLAPGSSAYPAGYHAGNIGGLVAIDEHLVAGQIKKDTVIFGVTGTFESTLAEDRLGSAAATEVTATEVGWNEHYLVPANDDVDVATKTQTYDPSSLAVAVGQGYFGCNGAEAIKLRLYMEGTQVAESGWAAQNASTPLLVIATRALSDEKTCKIALHDYSGTSKWGIFAAYAEGDSCPAGIGIGSVKLV